MGTLDDLKYRLKRNPKIGIFVVWSIIVSVGILLGEKPNNTVYWIGLSCIITLVMIFLTESGENDV